MARAEYFRVRLREVCACCKAELSEGAAAVRAKNGETYGVECHRKVDAKTVSHGDHRHRNATRAARCTALHAHAEPRPAGAWREKVFDNVEKVKA